MSNQKRGGASPRRKGNGFERGVVALLQERGLNAVRVPCSGSVKTSNKFDHDVSVTIHGVDRRIECKRRARSFKTIDAMLADNYALVCRNDRSRPLVVMTIDTFTELASEMRGSATLYGNDISTGKEARRLPA